MVNTSRDIYCEEDLERIMKERYKKKRFFRHRSKHADDVSYMGEPENVLSRREQYEKAIEYYESKGLPVPEHYRRFLCD